MIGKGLDCLFPRYHRFEIPGMKGSRYLRVRCGTCFNCKMFRRQEWCLRLQMESKYWTNMSFLTLTYDDEHLPMNEVSSYVFEQEGEEFYFTFPTLASEHLRNFIKQLRNFDFGEVHRFSDSGNEQKDFRKGLRYFAVGEYGTGRTKRPHYHLMLFGVGCTRENANLIQKIWGKGFIDLKPFTPERCVYIAGYVQKKLYGNSDGQTDIYKFKIPEFLRCSQHLGEDYILEHINEFDENHCYIVQNGFKKAMPRQFRKLLIKKGVVPDHTLNKFWCIQQEERTNLINDLRSKNVELSDFFRNRIELAKHKVKRISMRRDKTGDI